MEPMSTPWLGPDEQRAWRGWVEVHARLNARIHRQLQEASGLSLADYAILVELTSERASDASARMFELGERLAWEKSRVSKQVTRMEARGLVVRRHCPDDRRGSYVDLTDAGRAAIEAAAPAHVKLVREMFFDVVPHEDVLRLADLTTAVLARLDATD
ncbi:winged helix-turn-helix transcriptional regulator [Nocardioides sp. zg-ZUI104]|nr:winged helix-turn-helix transcriptional regulator [Nocardioides faecalis]